MRLIKTLPLAVVLALVGLITFAGTGLAADAATTNSDSQSLLDLLKPVFEAFSGGHYAYAAALGTIALVALVKRYLGPKVPFLHTDAGGSLLALTAACATAMAAALAAPGATVTLGLLKTAMLVGVGAAGGYAMLKNLLIEPLLKPLAAKAPAWMQPLFALVFWIFDKPSPVQQAEQAGVDAVKANPGQGVETTTGKPTDVK